MRCPKCNFENRPDARFCKRCGQPLAAPTAPPAQVAVCPACGVTAKPGARFCPRCGQPLPATPPAQPQGYAQPPAPAQPYAQPPAPAQSQGYAQPPAAPPPPTAQPPQKRKLPRWALWAGIAAAVFLCIIAVVVVGPKIFGAEREPVASLTPVESPTVAATEIEAPPAETPTTEAPTAVQPTAVPPTAVPPTAVPPTATPTPIFDAQVTTIPLTSTVRVGDSLTVTVTLTNKGNVSFGKLRYQLSGEWESALELVTDIVVSHDAATVLPDELDTATFIFKGLQEGDVTFHVNVTLEVQEESPRWESRSSEIIYVSVTQ